MAEKTINLPEMLARAQAVIAEDQPGYELPQDRVRDYGNDFMSWCEENGYADLSILAAVLKPNAPRLTEAHYKFAIVTLREERRRLADDVVTLATELENHVVAAMQARLAGNQEAHP